MLVSTPSLVPPPPYPYLAVWSINLGELRFSEEQCSKLADALRLSGVTHMFYECTVAGDWKDTFRNIIRNNRAKHGFWRLGPDAEQNRVVLAAVKSWCLPTLTVTDASPRALLRALKIDCGRLLVHPCSQV